MQITLNGGLLRIQWTRYADPAIEAEIISRLQGIYSAIKGNRERCWHVHLDQLEAVQAAFPNASYAPEVWAAYPVKVPEVKAEQPPVQGKLWDTEAIAAKERRMDGIRQRNRYNRRRKAAR